ncbi:uncharacterized protein PV07_04030 [Cladophialophora immunda]|uniref:Uncharacterized protein n=1 Tax=Cladophialophora immunda TaxID=569365 RepID=A0A0D2B4N5_9EURO|nr:uncharacterized protein PV07_04030 [Cladophialophora immunda]KIW32487.1 hypothetical protein PV07_04030 [Cladophialophora immunda]
MCIWDLAVFQCGHNGGFSRRDGGCALPTMECNKERVNAIRYHIPWNCPDCAQRVSRGIPLHPEDHLHPLARSVQQPMLPVALPPQAVSRRGTARRNPSPINVNRRDNVHEDGYDFSEYAEYANYATLPQKRLSNTSPTNITKRQRVSRSQYSSDTPRMFGRLGNIAQDLTEIAMPSARERRSGGISYSPTSVRLHGTVQDVSEIPPSLIPGIVNTSPSRRRHERSPLLLYDAGVAKRRKPSYPPPRRISPTQPKAPYATTEAASASTTYSPSTYSNYAVASQAAKRQKKAATRTYKETYDDVERMIQDGHSREEIMATAKFAMLTAKDQEEIFWPYKNKLQARANERNGTLEGRRMHNVRPREEGKPGGRRKRDGCVVM